MATIAKGNDGKDSMADQQEEREEVEERDEAEEAEDREEKKPVKAAAADKPAAPKPGLFAIYKRGQGYWTRMGTAAGAGLVAFVLAAFFFERLKVWLPLDPVTRQPRIGLILLILAAALAALGLWVFRLLNKPGNVDFLVATESEMKKVNWTTRKELIGSTKVVILFMFLIAMILFVIDIGFGYFFRLIRVLEFGPFDLT